MKTFFLDDGRIESWRALQNGDEEDEEQLWSGQMCSNVFWPDLRKDNNMNTHTYTHLHTHTHTPTPLCYSSVGRKKERFFFVDIFSITLCFAEYLSLPPNHSWSYMQTHTKHTLTHTHTHTHTQTHTNSPFTWRENLMCHPTVRHILCCWF